jgi:hypothetical protein
MLCARSPLLVFSSFWEADPALQFPCSRLQTVKIPRRLLLTPKRHAPKALAPNLHTARPDVMAMASMFAGEAQQGVEEKADGRLRGGSEDAMRDDESVVDATEAGVWANERGGRRNFTQSTRLSSEHHSSLSRVVAANECPEERYSYSTGDTSVYVGTSLTRAGRRSFRDKIACAAATCFGRCL